MYAIQTRGSPEQRLRQGKSADQQVARVSTPRDVTARAELGSKKVLWLRSQVLSKPKSRTEETGEDELRQKCCD